VQENPQFVQSSSERFAALLKENTVLWDTLLHRSEKMKDNIDDVKAQLRNANLLQKISQTSKAKELSQKEREYHAAVENERTMMKDFLTLIESTKQLSEPANAQELPAVLYWRDSDGEHCIATNEQVLLTA
jgi:acetylglutamate synthase